MQNEAIEILSNVVARTSDQMLVVKSGIIPSFIDLLQSGPHNYRVAANSAWSLGNFASSASLMRDCILEHNVVEVILHIWPELIRSPFSHCKVSILDCLFSPNIE